MSETNSEIILAPDATFRVVISRRDDGNYKWRHEAYVPPDPEYGWEGDWDTVHPGISGLYNTRERALSDARMQVAWLGKLDSAPETVVRPLPWWRRFWPSWLTGRSRS